MKAKSDNAILFVLGMVILVVLIYNNKPQPIPPQSPSKIDTLYMQKTDTLKIKQIKIKQKYDTLYMYFLDSPYSTTLLDSAINIHRQLDAKGLQ